MKDLPVDMYNAGKHRITEGISIDEQRTSEIYHADRTSLDPITNVDNHWTGPTIVDLRSAEIPSGCVWEPEDGKWIRHHRIPREVFFVSCIESGPGSSDVTRNIARFGDRRVSVQFHMYRDQPATYEDNWRTSGSGPMTEPWSGDSISEERDTEEIITQFYQTELRPLIHHLFRSNHPNARSKSKV